jgi:putative restriction endonuclease
MTSSTRKPWTRDELMVMMNVYRKLPFGQFDQSQKVIQDIARRMGRTPGSVAMKLSNLASFDPALTLRGRKGLPGASRLDRQIWDEAHDGEALDFTEASELAFRVLFTSDESADVELVKGVGVEVKSLKKTAVTSARRPVKVRLGQSYFRQIVLNTFDNQCCITAISMREFLIASHILPWSDFEASRLDPQNGLCLSQLHDAAFDSGLITFDEDLRLVIGRDLRHHFTNETLFQSFQKFEGCTINIPTGALPPNPRFLEHHREHIFQH